MMMVVHLLITFYLLALFAHIASVAIVMRRYSAIEPKIPTGSLPPVTLVRPVCGLDEIERTTLASTFGLAARDVEILFCAMSSNDPAVDHLKWLIDRHPDVNARILIGDDLGTANPKLNNIAKGWREASHDWIIFADSNLLLPPDYIARVLQAWRTDTGLVCAPPIGSQPGNFWAEVECAFLNTYQARWQYMADAVGYGFAQGKTMLWRTADLEGWGGIAALSTELAEDAAATKLVRAAGLSVHLAAPSPEQPLGCRSAEQVISRQLRWAQLRRLSFPAHFVPEVFTGILPPLIAGCVAAGLLGLPVWPLAVTHCAVWLAAEAVLARRAGWHLGWLSPLAWVLRDALIPMIWLRAWIAHGYHWRGNAIDARPAVSMS